MITLTGVTKAYPGGTGRGPILQNVNLRIGKGEFLYVVGDSGAGKTTLLKMLYGDETPTQGNVEIFGQNIAKMDSTRLQALRRKMGVIFQDLKLIEDLTAYDNVALALEISGGKRGFLSVLSATGAGAVSSGSLAWKRAIDEALGMVGAGSFARKKISLLSGGERQRVAAARAIVRNPEILIADEPTGSLDREHTWSLMDLFQKMHLRGATVLIATHDREIVRRVRRRSCVLKSGKLMVEEGICLF